MWQNFLAQLHNIFLNHDQIVEVDLEDGITVRCSCGKIFRYK